MSAEQKLAEHGVSITVTQSGEQEHLRPLVPSPVTTVKIKYDRGTNFATVLDGYPDTPRWLRIVITFAHRHCPFLSLSEIMDCLHINRHWINAHATATPIEILELHAMLNAAGIDCGESP